MDETEMLARMWIECDPNRSVGSEPGSGYHPDDVEPDTQVSGLMGSGETAETVETPNPSAGKKRWEWFTPRAKASLAYFEKHGFKLVRVE